MREGVQAAYIAYVLILACNESPRNRWKPSTMNSMVKYRWIVIVNLAESVKQFDRSSTSMLHETQLENKLIVSLMACDWDRAGI